MCIAAYRVVLRHISRYHIPEIWEWFEEAAKASKHGSSEGKPGQLSCCLSAGGVPIILRLEILSLPPTTPPLPLAFLTLLSYKEKELSKANEPNSITGLFSHEFSFQEENPPTFFSLSFDLVPLSPKTCNSQPQLSSQLLWLSQLQSLQWLLTSEEEFPEIFTKGTKLPLWSKNVKLPRPMKSLVLKFQVLPMNVQLIQSQRWVDTKEPTLSFVDEF